MSYRSTSGSEVSDAFPSTKFFRIVNEGTGLCLAAAHGGTTHGAQKAQDRWTGEEGYIPYSHTNDQVLTLRTPTGHRGEVWFFSEIKNTYGDEDWHLVNAKRTSAAPSPSTSDPWPASPSRSGWVCRAGACRARPSGTPAGG
jgi:hypothetical protein